MSFKFRVEKSKQIKFLLQLMLLKMPSACISTRLIQADWFHILQDRSGKWGSQKPSTASEISTFSLVSVLLVLVLVLNRNVVHQEQSHNWQKVQVSANLSTVFVNMTHHRRESNIFCSPLRRIGESFQGHQAAKIKIGFLKSFLASLNCSKAASCTFFKLKLGLWKVQILLFKIFQTVNLQIY